MSSFSLTASSVQRGLHHTQQSLKALLQVVLLSAIWLSMDVARQHFGWSMPADRKSTRLNSSHQI